METAGTVTTGVGSVPIAQSSTLKEPMESVSLMFHEITMKASLPTEEAGNTRSDGLLTATAREKLKEAPPTEWKSL